MEKKEALIVFVLAALVTLLSAVPNQGFCRSGFPCGFYYNLSPRGSGPSVVYGVYCPACFLPLAVPQSISALLRSMEVSIGYHSSNALFFVDLLFWFLVLGGGWFLFKKLRKRGEIKNV